MYSLNEQKFNQHVANMVLYAMIFMAFFEYLFMHTRLPIAGMHMFLITAITIASFFVMFTGRVNITWLWALFYLLILIHWGVNSFSMYYFLIYISTIFIPSFFSHFTEKTKKNVVNFILIICAFFAIGCFFQLSFEDLYLSTIPKYFTLDARDFIILSHNHDVFTGFTYQPTATAAALTIGIIVNWTQIKSRKKLVILQVILYWALLLTAKRSFLLISVTVPLIMYYFSSGKNNRIFKLIMILVMAILIAYFYNSISVDSDLVIFERMNKFFEDDIDLEVATSGRTNLINDAVNLFEQYPVFGIGFGQFAKRFDTAVHNVYLQLLCEMGLVGFVAFVFPALGVLCINIKKLGSQYLSGYKKESLLIALGLQLAFLIYSFTGNPLYNTQWIYIYFISVAIAMTIKLENNGGENEENRNSHVSLCR